MRLAAKIAAAVVIVLLLVLGAAYAAVNLVPWNSYKGMIEDQAREATGRDLAIKGDLSGGLSLGLDLEVEAENVQFANAAGAERQNMLTLGGLRLRMQLLPLLLDDRVVVDSLLLQKPVVNLAMDAEGRPNWQFAETAEPAPARSGGEELPVAGVSIGELSIEQGTLRYDDAVTGQKLRANEVMLSFGLESLDRPLHVDGSMVLNEEPLTLAADIDTPRGLIDGAGAKTALALDSKHIEASYRGRVQRQPVAGLDGEFALDVPSVGRLMAWLDRPLAKGQPDPGPLKMRASFASDGAKVELKQATIEGEELQARASGSFDGSGEVAKVALKVESGVLNIDRYLPPPAAPARPARRPAGDGKGVANPLQALSDEPLDLSALKSTDADVEMRIEGVRASGYRLGPTAFTATLKGGVLNAELARMGLYGGNVSGMFGLDASGEALAAKTNLAVEKVKVDQLAEAATGEKSVVGIASGTLAAESQGKSPRALAQNLKGTLDFNLGDVRNAPGGAISEVALRLDLPGLEAEPKLAGHVVYNKKRVDFDATVAPLGKALAQETIAVDLKLESEPLTLAYVGAVRHRPAPGLDGKFNLDVPSVGALAAWLGQPLPDGQPDPGPLTVAAELQSDGKVTALRQATIVGKALEAAASGSVDTGGAKPSFEAEVEVAKADLDAYLPTQPEKAAEAPAAAGPGGWSEEPYDFSGLRTANGKATISLADVTYRGLKIERGRIAVTMDQGVATAKVEELATAGGSVAADATVDASGEVPQVSYQASVKGVEARPFLKAFAGSDRLSGKANIEAEGRTRGASQRDMVAALNGKGSLQFLNGAIHGINIAQTLRRARSLGFDEEAGETQKTDFAELGGSYVITDGLLENRDMKMLAPLVRLSGSGVVPLPPRTVDYAVEAKLVGTLKGQGGKDALAGIPIPIKITGSWAAPAYSVDWDSVLKTVAADPERMANLPGALADKAKDLGISLPGLEGAGDFLKGITGGGDGDGDAQPREEERLPNPADTLKRLFK